jgi:hypothetical protein
MASVDEIHNISELGVSDPGQVLFGIRGFYGNPVLAVEHEPRALDELHLLFGPHQDLDVLWVHVERERDQQGLAPGLANMLRPGPEPHTAVELANEVPQLLAGRRVLGEIVTGAQRLGDFSASEIELDGSDARHLFVPPREVRAAAPLGRPKRASTHGIRSTSSGLPSLASFVFACDRAM